MTTSVLLSDVFSGAARGKKLRKSGYAGAAEALALYSWWRQHKQAIVYIARDSSSAAHLVEELSFFAPEAVTRLLPGWECLPFDETSPPPETQSERIATLAAMNSADIIVTSAAAALLPYAPVDFINARAFNWRVGDTIDIRMVAQNLTKNGYVRTERVMAAGEFTIYGGQVDIFAVDATAPFRLVLVDDTIEQIRIFDPQTQLSVNKTQSLKLLPMSECDLSPVGINRFKRQFIDNFGGRDFDGLKKINNGQLTDGIECLLPLFFERVARLPDYIPDESLVVLQFGARHALAIFEQQAQRRQHESEVYKDRPTLPTNEVFLSLSAWDRLLKNFATVQLGKPPLSQSPPDVRIDRRKVDSHASLKAFIKTAKHPIILATDSVGRREMLRAALVDNKISAVDSFVQCKDKISAVVAPLRGGFQLSNLTLLAESELFDIHLPPRRQRIRATSVAEELSVGDIVVHPEYGIGQYKGLADRSIGDTRGEFLQVAYADEQNLWLPVSQIHLLSPYHGNAEELSKLGSSRWRRIRARAQKNARDTAARLLAIAARRRIAQKTENEPDKILMARFIDEFQYEETPDQQVAAQATLDDMATPTPMDRLLVADVGFGKTEVAMRAAWAAVLSGRQVAVLSPTTLLAEQHARTFGDRFAGFSANIALLTRLSTKIEKQRILKDIADGTADIIIGTHALLQPSARFKWLGLLIIDEEHRFGVRQKEHLKALRADMDVLALSATPIPRTMAMALDGLRDISIITTPPPSRHSIQTTVAAFSQEIIVNACERELLRGGQVYFVHNDIRALPMMADKVKEWLPEAVVDIIHGSMSPPSIERAMRNFMRGDTQILLTTIIIESGLDIANANTIIINRADHIGISRLHQLRGRVGRSTQQAYAYLLTPPLDMVSNASKARLDALSHYGALGDGFHLAMRDMETRGAGEALGEKQSGDIIAIGYAAYQKMLNAAARQLQGDDTWTDIESLVELSQPALLPEKYIHSANERLRYYRRLCACENGEEIFEVRLEWEDRFGKLPESARRLLSCHRLRLVAAAARVAKLRVSANNTAHIEFADTPVNQEALMNKINQGLCHPLHGQNAVTIKILPKEENQCIDYLLSFLKDCQ